MIQKTYKLFTTDAGRLFISPRHGITTEPFAAAFPELKGIFTFGNSIEEVEEAAIEAAQAYLEGLDEYPESREFPELMSLNEKGIMMLQKEVEFTLE